MEQPNYGAESIQNNQGLIDLTDPLGKALSGFKSRFVAAYQAAQEAEDELSPDILFRARAFAVSMAILALAGSLLLEFCAPADAGASFLHSSLAVAPVSAFVFCATRAFAGRQMKMLLGFQSAVFVGLGLWAASLFLALSGAVWGLNIGLDKAASLASFTVVDRHTVYSDSEPKDYVTIHLQGHQEDVRVTPPEYAEALPGNAQLQLKLHKGFFGLPWYESRYVFTSRRTSSDFAPVIEDQSIDYKGIFHYSAAP